MRTPAQAPEAARQLAVLAQRVGEPREAGDRRRHRCEQDQGAGEADVDAQRVPQPQRQLASDPCRHADERRADPPRPELGLRPGEGRERDDGDRDVHGDDGRDPPEHRSRQVDAGAARLLREVGDGLEAGEGEHRERHREREGVPRRMRSQGRPVGERMRREHEDEPEHDEQKLRQQVERRHDDAEPVERRTPHDADQRDERDHADADDDVPRVPVERRHLQRAGQVVRQEQRGERDHDQVVEEERPPRQEPGEIVQRAPDERRGAARLRQSSRALGVGERHDQEENADDREHDRREPKRVRREHAQREVDRRGDLAVGDGEERASIELTPEPCQLAGYRALPCSIQRRPAPAAMKSAPSRIPTPNPRVSVTAIIARPSTTIRSAIPVTRFR